MEPLIISLDSKQLNFSVLFINDNGTYDMEIFLESENNLKSATINCDYILKRILLPFHSMILNLKENEKNVFNFVKEVNIILTRELEKGTNGILDFHFPKYYKILFDDMKKIGWQNLVLLNCNFTEIHLRNIDNKERIHLLKIFLDSQHPIIGPDIKFDLPFDNIKLEWSNCEQSLSNLYNKFVNMILEFQLFWDFMDEIDLKTWIIEPQLCTRSCCRRCIAINDYVSIEIMLDPLHIIQPPNCNFLGPETETNELKKCFYSNIVNWNEHISLLENLKSILQIDFPQKKSLNFMTEQQDCSICYTSDFDGYLPDKRCDAKCPAIFHNACLLKWLKSLPSTRQSFNFLFGECPNCKKSINIKI